MGWFKKKRDPISERERALKAQIAGLESQIRKLTAHEAQRHAAHDDPLARTRSAALPRSHPGANPAPTPEALFEPINQNRLGHPTETATLDHFNELGVRKYDLAAFWHRFKSNFRGPATSNPKLVNYLAAGSIQGLRPLRYEKRVARNRFIAFVTLLILALWGMIAMLIRR